MPISVNLVRELESIEPKLRRVLLLLIEELEHQSEESVTKKEFNELKEIVRDLAEAQKRTELEIQKLTGRMDAFEVRLEGISSSVGYGLENSSYKALPSLLLQRYGIKVEDKLTRRYITIKNKNIQVNVFGYAKR